jgi:hypothetical protein
MAKTESTCLLNGVHQLGSPYAAECPLNPECVQRRRERALSIWAAPRRRGKIILAAQSGTTATEGAS